MRNENFKTINVTERAEAYEKNANSFIETVKGFGYTFKRFFQHATGEEHNTISYPEEKRPYSNRFRGTHILTVREDGSIKCVACFMCATACPADCITIEAAEHPDKSIEKYAKRFDIDMLRCVFCGFCIDACPEEAIIMSREHEISEYTRDTTIYGIDRLMNRPQAADMGPGYRPNYPMIESKLPFVPLHKDPEKPGKPVFTTLSKHHKEKP